jgi:predicted NBD/HSP70 family sugar kinase
MENGMVIKSEVNVAAVSEMLQGAATKDSAILAILQQL